MNKKSPIKLKNIKQILNPELVNKKEQFRWIKNPGSVILEDLYIVGSSHDNSEYKNYLKTVKPLF